MPALAETQAAFRHAVAGEPSLAVAGLLVAPCDPIERLSIYRRHYRESFRRHLRGRYPTLEWLIGTPRMTALADAVLRARPPRAPSLAEYGAELADIIAGPDYIDLPPYVADIARLDWRLGHIAVEIEAPAIAIAGLAAIPPQRLGEVRLDLQPGLSYLRSPWPVDELVRLRVTETAPDQLAFAAETVHLELRGARGKFGWQRLGRGEFLFRQSLQADRPLAAAAEKALGDDPGFDISAALARLFAEGLATAIHSPHKETQDD